MTSRPISIRIPLGVIAGAVALAVAAPAGAMTLPPDSVVVPAGPFQRPWVDLGAHDLNAAPVVKRITVFNGGDVPLSLPTPTVGRPSTLPGRDPDLFSLAGETCSAAPLHPEASCTVSIRLTPSNSSSPRGNGSATSELTVRPQGHPAIVVRLRAQVLHPSYLSPMVRAPLKLGWARPGRTSPPKQMSLQLIGGYDLVPGRLALVGPDADQFAIAADRCSGVPLKPHARCTYDVTFTPTSPGRKTAAVTVVGAGAPRQALSVEGTGLPTIGATLRVLARRAGYGIAGPKLARSLAKPKFSLGVHAWPAAGSVRAWVELVMPGGRRRTLARSGATAVAGTGGESVVVTVQRGARRALLGGGKRRRAVVRFQLTEADGVKSVGERRLRVSGRLTTRR